jgi:hypothetical protein
MISWVTRLVAFTIPSAQWEIKQKKVVIGVAMLGRVFHNNPLDHMTPKGVKEFGEAVNQFILWNRHEIVLDRPTSPQNQLMSPLSQTAMPKDNEAPLPMSPPPVPKFKEASLPSSLKEKEASPLPTSPVKVMPQ